MAESKRELGAKKLVTVNGRVQPGDSVVVVADEKLVDIAELVSSAATNAGAQVVTCIMPTRILEDRMRRDIMARSSSTIMGE